MIKKNILFCFTFLMLLNTSYSQTNDTLILNEEKNYIIRIENPKKGEYDFIFLDSNFKTADNQINIEEIRDFSFFIGMDKELFIKIFGKPNYGDFGYAFEIGLFGEDGKYEGCWYEVLYSDSKVATVIDLCH